MKTNWMYVIVLASVLAAGAGANPPASMSKEKGKESEIAPHGQPEGADIAVLVNGMVCSFCAQGITEKFKAMPEVQGVEVRMAESRVYLTTRKGEYVEDKAIAKAVKWAGYDLEKIDRLFDTSGKNRSLEKVQ